MKEIFPNTGRKVEKSNKKISVIVTVYNIERYLEKCIDSIRRQTYKNLEIILVDDGSTDNSGAMCDRFAADDDRIVVIHKKNGGLADARNTGAKAATGEYIAYVDGDDWIDREMYEAMLHEMETCQADVVICSYRCIYPDKIVDDSTDNRVVFEGREALKAYIEEDEHYQIQNAAWNKLYRKNFAQGLQFPRGKWYEDIVYTAKLLAISHRTVYLDKAYYNYVLEREGSIMSVGVNERILTDQMPAYFERSQYLREIGEYELAACHDYFLYKRMLLAYTAFVRSRCRTPEERIKKKKNLKKLRKLILEQKPRFEKAYNSTIANPNEEKKMKIFLCSASLYNIAMRLNDKYLIPYKEKKALKRRVSHLHVIQLMGGLGNQMFQYALYRELLSQGKTAMIEDESGYKAEGTREKYLQKAFALKYKRPTEEEMQLLTDSSMKIASRIRRKIFGRKENSFVEKQFNFNPDVFLQESAYYEGCWQSDKYFKDVVEELRVAFTFHCEVPEASQNFVEKIDSRNSVSLHIRRGDYLNDTQIGVYGGICTESYYKQAVTMMKEKVPRASFFIFTNDPVYVKEHISGEDFEVVDCNDEEAGYLDMLLMSHCKHHIIANSSFSWWGAWLCNNPDKIVIAPSRWLNDRDCSDIYTEGMLVISGNI